MVEFFGFSMSAIVPDGPSDGTSAESSTMVMSPPPRAGAGSMFMAGFRSGIVWTLSGAEMMFACAAFNLMEERNALKTDARAVSGLSVMQARNKDISVGKAKPPERAIFDDLYFVRGEHAKSAEESFLRNKISLENGELKPRHGR